MKYIREWRRRRLARRLLDEAAAIIERWGWQQHGAGFGEAPHCAWGALREAQEHCYTPLTSQAYRVALRAAGDLCAADLGYGATGTGMAAVVAWNDQVCTSQGEAVHMLRTAKLMVA